ncbi:MAG: prolyl oligopeptidase family serine peptidase [candidate division Zixibacteria bacterium]|nr:prolyl oligopeptidase family serine peptidase [candidate division Zixibacteria bacterium]
MKTRISLFLITLTLAILIVNNTKAQTTDVTENDTFIWLEDAQGAQALDWVKAQNDLTLKEFSSDPNFPKFQDIALTILNSKNRIPYGSYEGNQVYNFWQDEAHVKGILRRTSLKEYIKKNPRWETVLDIDKLSADEGKDYVYGGTTLLPPGRTRGMIALSVGGGDAVIYREFDYESKSFVKDGFSLPEAKSDVAWYDSNTLLVGTDFGPGSMTSSGYPRLTKMWKRGTPLSEAATILEGEISDVSAAASVSFRPEGELFFLSRGINFWESIRWLVDSSGNKTELPFPRDSYIMPFKGRLLARLNSEWLGLPEGSLVALKIADLQSPDLQSKIDVIFKPDDKSVIGYVICIKDYILVTVLENVRAKALYYWPDESGGADQWNHGHINLPDMGSIGITSADDFSNTLMLSYDDFLTPTKLYLLDNPGATPREIKSLPESFAVDKLKVEQFFATSKDGTSIPYFMVSRKDLKLDGANPTLLYGYGGFRSLEMPSYSRTLGKIWLTNGGVYVLANIRGGGEFGPRWHKAGLLENRQKVFDDFIAIAEDLCRRRVTSPAHLGIMGGSNGGLLVGVSFIQRPDLFKAVVCQVPLLDMLRYTKIGAGASWMAEYGDPEIPEQRAFIEKYSPYQNLKSGVKYPEVFFETSTADDRVHPAHARKMAAKMEQMGYKVYFSEEMSGGHSSGADNIHRAQTFALEYTYLWKMLK